MTRIAKLAGVCGWPIHQSLSPLMHNFWLKEGGLAGAYVPFAVRPDEAFRAFKSLKRTSIGGVNVTMPLKHTAFEAADDVTEDAQKLGVVNCLYVRDGRLIGHNTDMEGFAAPLLQKLSAAKLSQSTALIIGAGGAAKAVIGALLSIGVPEIRVTNRTDSRAEDICQQADLPTLHAVPWAARHDSLQSADLIINASAGGMKGKPALDLNLAQAPKTAFVYDLIYTPRTTGLLRQAKTHPLHLVQAHL